MHQFTILAVDDDPKVLEIIRRSLKRERHIVITAESAEEGVAILDEVDVDMVISDYSMSGMTGIDFLRYVKKEYPEVLTILQSGYSDYKLAMEAINSAGVYKLIEKPWRADWFAETVSNLLTTMGKARGKQGLLNRVRAYEAELDAMELQYPGITSVERDKDGYIVVRDIDV